jgi:flagellar basal body-associated protein FliL
MAKADKNEGEVQEQQLQQPEPPPKKKKKGLSLPLIIGISFAALLILIGGTLGAVYLMVNNMMQHTNTEQSSEANNHEEESDEDSENSEFDLESKYAELQVVVERQTKNIQFMELGEIITNPKNSNRFVVIDIGVEYVAYNENGEVVKTGEGEEGAEESKSAEEFFGKRDLAKVRSIINKVIWENSESELQNKRSELPGILKEDFKEIFLENGAIIKDVVILRFIIQ